MYPGAEVRGLGLCRLLGFAEPEVRVAARTSCQGRAQGKCNQHQGGEDSALTKHWQHQQCRIDPGAGNSLHIPWQSYHHNWRHWGRCWGQEQKDTSCFIHFKTNMEIKVHHSVGKDKDLPFRREVGSALWSQDLVTNIGDHHPTPDLQQP